MANYGLPYKGSKNRYKKYIASKQYIHNVSPSLQNYTQLTRLQSLERLERLERLEILSSDYSTVNIKPDSIIYCDIPYANTDGYLNSFDFNKFYDWAERQTELVFISSYAMPEDRFEVVAQYEHRSTLSAISNNLVIEKVFIPKTQLKLYKENQVQPSLFDEFLY